MTILLATRTDSGVFIACDTLSCDGGMRYTIETKWVQFGHWWIGVSGPAVYMQFIGFSEEPPPPDIKGLVGFIRRCLIANGVETDKEHKTQLFGMHLIAVKGRDIWTIDTDLLAIKVPEDDWAVVGSGELVAKGALHVIAESSPDVVAEDVIRACGAYMTTVDGFWGKYVMVSDVQSQPVRAPRERLVPIS